MTRRWNSNLTGVNTHTHTHTQTFNGLFFQDNLVRPVPEGLDFAEARDDGVAVLSVEPYANHLHLAPDRQPRQHLITPYFLQAGCPFCRPTNSVKALKAIHLAVCYAHISLLTYRIIVIITRIIIIFIITNILGIIVDIGLSYTTSCVI